MMTVTYISPYESENSVGYPNNLFQTSMKDERRFECLLSALGTPPLFTSLRVNTLKTNINKAIDILKERLQEVSILNVLLNQWKLVVKDQQSGTCTIVNEI